MRPTWTYPAKIRSKGHHYLRSHSTCNNKKVNHPIVQRSFRETAISSDVFPIFFACQTFLNSNSLSKTSTDSTIEYPENMCIVIVTTAHPDYPLILLNNRDVRKNFHLHLVQFSLLTENLTGISPSTNGTGKLVGTNISPRPWRQRPAPS